ncbi:MAG: glycosyltransferase [Armatimonadota bacterium]
MFTGMTGQEWLTLWRDVCIALAWFVVIVFLVGGIQDLFYDVVHYVWRIYRRIRFRKRERLSLAKLRAREQQRIAVFVPAWQEGRVIGDMLAQTLEKVEYHNYTVFIGTYPNDPETQQAVDALTQRYPQVVKVVADRPGPTNKAHNLNNLYAAMKAYERRHGVRFEITVMHDAEDVVHPHSFMLYNYLIPRVDAVQIPILPLPVPFTKWVHWLYADEFAENHLKDIVAREKIHGFVPYAGVGTCISRHALLRLEEECGCETPFDESSLTEDYNVSRKANLAHLNSVFVNVVLQEEKPRRFTPLARREAFIANWSYFPTQFARSVRQKTRWIVGISLQDWKLTGWKGSLADKENLFRDRKVFISAATTFLGYILAGYFILYELGRHGLAPFKLMPFIYEGTLLYTLVIVTTAFMLLRMIERMVFVTTVYGLGAGLLSIPRLILGNILNGIAAFRALFVYLRALTSRRQLGWDKTEHLEGVGQMPNTPEAPRAVESLPHLPVPLEEIMRRLDAEDAATIVDGLEAIPRYPDERTQGRLQEWIEQHGAHADTLVRAEVARVSGYLRWPGLESIVLRLVTDPAWVVRANAARALIKFPHFGSLLQAAFATEDRYAREVLIHTVEGDVDAQNSLLPCLDRPDLTTLRAALLEGSAQLRAEYEKSLRLAEAPEVVEVGREPACAL